MNKPLFHIPRTLDEIMVAVAFVAWPFIYYFLLRPEDPTPAADVVGWLIAFGIQAGIAFAMQNARRHA